MVHAGHRRPSASAVLSPSNADHAAPKPRTKPVASRYLSSPSSGKHTSSAASSPSSRRPVSQAPWRLASAADRSRPAPQPSADGGAATTMRTLSVAFQSPSYSLDTSKARPVAPAATTPEKRRSSAVPWPATANAALRAFHGRTLANSLDRSPNKKEPAAAIAAARSREFEETPRRESVDGAEQLHLRALSSDTESASSSTGSNSNDGGAGIAAGARPSPRSIAMSPSSRLSRDTSIRSLSDRFAYRTAPFLPRTPSSSPTPAPGKKKSLLTGLFSRPSLIKPATGGNSRSSTASRSPSPVRSSPTVPGFAVKIQGNLEGDMRRKSPGVCKAEEEHQLKVLYNRHLQWRRAIAQAEAASSSQARAAEEYLYSAWIAILGMLRSVALKKFQLQLFHNNCKLLAIRRGQMIYLEEWSLLEKKHASSLSGTMEALNATILRLPVSDGAVADIQAVKIAVGTAIDVMQTIGNSTSTLSKLARTNVLVSQLSRIAIQEHVLMAQCRELMSTLTSMHVRYSSLQGQRIQLNQRMTVRF